MYVYDSAILFIQTVLLVIQEERRKKTFCIDSRVEKNQSCRCLCSCVLVFSHTVMWNAHILCIPLFTNRPGIDVSLFGDRNGPVHPQYRANFLVNLTGSSHVISSPLLFSSLLPFVCWTGLVVK